MLKNCDVILLNLSTEIKDNSKTKNITFKKLVII